MNIKTNKVILDYAHFTLPFSQTFGWAGISTSTITRVELLNLVLPLLLLLLLVLLLLLP